MPKVKSLSSEKAENTVVLEVGKKQITIPKDVKIGDVIEANGLKAFYYNSKTWYVNKDGLIHACI